MSTTNTVEVDDRPKALRYAARVNAIEEMILDALPDIIGKVIEMAKDGNMAASRYLTDRIFGRIARVPAAPAGDKSLPYKTSDWTLDQLKHKDRRDSLAQVYMRDIVARNYGNEFGTRNGKT